MNYEIIYLEEKIVAGIVARTSNNASDMEKITSETWQKFFGDGIYLSIINKKNNNTISLYTNYEDKVNGAYDVVICSEISKEENLTNEIHIQKIEEGKYAKFVVRGKAKEAVRECWSEIWTMDLNRKYTFDFEEYIGGCEMDEQEINIYIAIN